ncbi:hypothetical protein D9M73_238470 [compost metagenome]
MHFPWRPGQVQRVGLDARHRVAQLPPVARRGQDGMAQMEVDIEKRVLDPVRIAEPERRANDPLAEHRRGIQPTPDMPDDVAEAGAFAMHGRRLVDGDQGAVRRRMRTVDVEEQGVLAGELAVHAALARLGNSLDTPCRGPAKPPAGDRAK